jgi:integrase
LTAAHTGARWSELVALRWEDFRPDLPLDDGAVAGPGRLKLRRPATNPTGREPESDERARRLIIHRTIALDQQAIDALLTHREQFGGRARARIHLRLGVPLSLLAGGYAMEKILHACSELSRDDVTAALDYTSSVVDEEKVVPLGA